jgi:hypothetical protein
MAQRTTPANGEMLKTVVIPTIQKLLMHLKNTSIELLESRAKLQTMDNVLQNFVNRTRGGHLNEIIFHK